MLRGDNGALCFGGGGTMTWVLLLWLSVAPDFPREAPEHFTNETDCKAAGWLVKGILDSDPQLRGHYPEVQWKFKCQEENVEK
jgi:hypothetical protein